MYGATTPASRKMDAALNLAASQKADAAAADAAAIAAAALQLKKEAAARTLTDVKKKSVNFAKSEVARKGREAEGVSRNKAGKQKLYTKGRIASGGDAVFALVPADAASSNSEILEARYDSLFESASSRYVKKLDDDNLGAATHAGSKRPTGTNVAGVIDGAPRSRSNSPGAVRASEFEIEALSRAFKTASAKP